MSKKSVYNNIERTIAIENFKKETYKKKKINSIVQNVCVFIISVISFSGIVFANDISTRIYENFYLTGKGTEKAINENYISKTNMDYKSSNAIIENTKTGKTIENSEIQVKVNEFIMDDFNLSLEFDVKLSEEVNNIITTNETYRINFSDLIVSDENNIVLFCDTKDMFNEFCKQNNLNYNYDTVTSENYIGSGLNTFITGKKENNINFIYNIYTGGECTYPKSKKLKFQMKQIKISNSNIETENEVITFKGDWNFEINVPEKMYNRKNTVYIQNKSTNKDYRITETIVYNTGMKVKMEINTKVDNLTKNNAIPLKVEFWNSLPESDECKTMDILRYITMDEMQNEEYVKNEELKNKQRELFNITAYIINSKGEKFEMTRGPSENGSKYINENGILEFEAIYDLTNYSVTDIITVYIEYNETKESIVLEKKEG